MSLGPHTESVSCPHLTHPALADSGLSPICLSRVSEGCLHWPSPVSWVLLTRLRAPKHKVLGDQGWSSKQNHTGRWTLASIQGSATQGPLPFLGPGIILEVHVTVTVHSPRDPDSSLFTCISSHSHKWSPRRLRNLVCSRPVTMGLCPCFNAHDNVGR